jgi:hypothetical protein
MGRNRYWPVCVAGLLIFSHCSKKTSPSATIQNIYDEDLTELRPEIQEYVSPEPWTPPPKMINAENARLDVTDMLEVILDSMHEVNKRTQFSQFTIQVHNSSRREAADSARLEVFRILPDSKPALEYVAPSYRVRVGRYFNQLEAYQTLLKLREQFPNAIIVPEGVYLK